MGRKALYQQLYCSMNGIPVGVITRRQGRMSFQYVETWLNHRQGRPISLSIPLAREEQHTEAVHAYFENLLPDNDNIRKKIVDSLGAASTHPFDLLEIIGADCVGALSITSQKLQYTDPEITVKKLATEDVAQVIRQSRITNMLGMEEDDDFRISLAGAQEKTALTWWDGHWCKPYGQTPTTHIIKPSINMHKQMQLDLSNSVDNEFFCLRFLQHMAIPVPQVYIQSFEEQRVLVVTRFDRLLAQGKIFRLPQEDMCQALGKSSGSKYQDKGGPGVKDIMDLLLTSARPMTDREIFMKCQLLFWLLAAIDGHAKNFSLFLRPTGYELTPIYDVMSAYPYFGQGNIQKKKIKMAMAVYGTNTHYHWNTIYKRHWLSTAEKVGYDKGLMENIIDDVITNTNTALEKTAQDLPAGFSENMAISISDHVKSALRRLTKS